MTMSSLKQKIDKKSAHIGVIGLGYVGLPLAVEFAQKGFSVSGFEVDLHKVTQINKGQSYIIDVASDIIKPLVKKDLFKATTDFQRLKEMDVIIICVPTPLRKSKDPDISYILSALEKVENSLRKNQLIILESTTYPGTTKEMMLPKLEGTGLKVGKDFFLAFSPERVDPGNNQYKIKNTPKIVGGITRPCTQIAKLLYSQIVEKVVPVSSTESAEHVKLLENTFRAVNIGLVNDVALMCDRLKLDTWEVIDAAATKPFGFMPFYPGPGIGGHCIPLDPHYLSWKLKTLNFYSRFIELAGEINSSMPEYLVQKIQDTLNDKGKSVRNSKILVLGVAYKKDVGDVRESPALDVIELLHKKGASLNFHDPYVKKIQINHLSLQSIPLSDKNLKKQDCIVITTHHSCFDIASIVTRSKLVIDSRNATKGIINPKIFKL